MPKISVIVPIYKSDAYLKECLDSILSQSFKDYELILVDDGSPDNCGNICDSYARFDKRIRVIHQSNQGQAAARNHAVAVSCSEWLCFVDSDDIIHPKMLEFLYHSVLSAHTDISMCSVLESTFCPNRFYEKPQNIFSVIEINESELFQLYNNDKYKPWIVCGKLIRKQIVEDLPFTEGKIYEDNAVVCRWLVKAAAVADLSTPLYFYRINSDGTTKSAFTLKHLDYLWALEQMTLFFENYNYHLLEKYFTELYITTASSYHNRVLNELKSKKDAVSIRKKLRRVYHQKRLIISIPKENLRYIYSAMYPSTKYFWTLISYISKVTKVLKRCIGIF